MRFRKPPFRLLMATQTMILIMLLSGKRMMALLRPEDVDVAAEAHPEVITVVSIVMEDIGEVTVKVTVEDIEEAPMAVIVEDSVATEVDSEAEVNVVESVVWISYYFMIICN
jgi:hypothetical protein